MSIADKILIFYRELDLPDYLPEGVTAMNPYRDMHAMKFCTAFYKKYYNDDLTRKLLLGINPGRFGGGITGIPFTDPVKLEEVCGIPNSFEKKSELSSTFIYEIIRSFGGPEPFYKRYYFSAVSPIGFLKNGKNLNYYDIRELQDAWEPFMVSALRRQMDFCDNNEVFSVGKGRNVQYLTALNKKYNLFGKVTALPHPRWVMQYRLKRKEEFIEMYRKLLGG